EAYRPLLAHQGGGASAPAVRVAGLQTRTERVADGVPRARPPAGRLVAGMGGDSVDLGRAGAKEPAPYVVTIQRDGTWYPSLVFTVTDWMLKRGGTEGPV